MLQPAVGVWCVPFGRLQVLLLLLGVGVRLPLIKGLQLRLSLLLLLLGLAVRLFLLMGLRPLLLLLGVGLWLPLLKGFRPLLPLLSVGVRPLLHRWLWLRLS